MSDDRSSDDAEKALLQQYLRSAREAVAWKLEGLSEYDQRRPLVPTGTNLLGLVKHLSGVEAGYFGLTFDRPFPDRLAWVRDQDADPLLDWWATADESPEQIVEDYRAMWAAADATIEALPLDAPGVVPWWRPETRNVTLRRIMIHVVAETHRHAGHADIVRELIDGAVGLYQANTNIPGADAVDYAAHYRRLVEIAERTRR